MRVLAILTMLLVGALLAAPAPLLVLENDERTRTLALPDDGSFTYRYRHSVYRATVVQELRAQGESLRLGPVRSADRRSLEYYGWPAEAYPEGDALRLDPPDLAVGPFAMRISREGAQLLAAGDRRIDLLAAFGETVVRVRPVRSTRAAWLLVLVAR